MIWQLKKAPLSPAWPVCQRAGPCNEQSFCDTLPSRLCGSNASTSFLLLFILKIFLIPSFILFFFFRDWTQLLAPSCFPGCCQYICLLSQRLNPGGHRWRQGPLVQSPQLTHHGELKIHPAALPTPGRALVPLILMIHLIQSNTSSFSRPPCSVNTKWTLICLLSGVLFISLGSMMRFPLPPPHRCVYKAPSRVQNKR